MRYLVFFQDKNRKTIFFFNWKRRRDIDRMYCCYDSNNDDVTDACNLY